jgi:hypothetical protein
MATSGLMETSDGDLGNPSRVTLRVTLPRNPPGLMGRGGERGELLGCEGTGLCCPRNEVARNEVAILVVQEGRVVVGSRATSYDALGLWRARSRPSAAHGKVA